jgi:hypothetical protein
MTISQTDLWVKKSVVSLLERFPWSQLVLAYDNVKGSAELQGPEMPKTRMTAAELV